jgi:3-oxoacyl-[acyl-carrier protein] reductase
MWDAVLDTHAKGTMFTSQEVAKLMVQRKRGSIVNAASVVAEYGNKGQSNYVAAKMAIIGLTKTHSKEWASKGIRVNAVAPGFIDTPMVAGMTIEAVESTKKLIPLGRLGNPDEIANAYAFLASDEASYITGAVLHVDGGTILPWTQ